MIKFLHVLKSSYRAVILSVVISSLFVLVANAQSTTSAISGFVSDDDGPIADAVVTAVHNPTNTAYYTITNNKGYYVFNNVIAGGPYTIKVDKMGYQSVIVTGVFAHLSEAMMANAPMNKASVGLDEVSIIGESEYSTMNIQRSGVNTWIDSRMQEAMPTISRSLKDMMKFVPQSISGDNGFSIGGSNYRGSAISVDGATFNNSFGIGSSLPAGGAPISLDAIDQINVNLTPYNVRYSGFQGGSINMVTKRGTNTWHGSVYDYFTCNKLQGQKVDRIFMMASTILR